MLGCDKAPAENLSIGQSKFNYCRVDFICCTFMEIPLLGEALNEFRFVFRQDSCVQYFDFDHSVGFDRSTFAFFYIIFSLQESN